VTLFSAARFEESCVCCFPLHAPHAAASASTATTLRNYVPAFFAVVVVAVVVGVAGAVVVAGAGAGCTMPMRVS
jgi:hypothetical protein